MTQPVEPESRSQACVYLYRDRNGTLRYVGRGATPERAQQHANGSHNAALAALIASGEYELEIAGPYNSYEIAAEVEAALISAMRRPGKHELYNRVPGNGHRFLPLGVPTELAERPLQPPLSVSEIGQRTGGALIVRNSFGKDPEPGRPRLDPLRIDTRVLVDNIRRKWLIENLRPTWIAEPEVAPKVVLAAAGPLKRRYVPAAVYLDTDGWGAVPAQELPLALHRSPELDACSLRGRLLSDAKFARGPVHHFIWVDASGVTQWPHDVRRNDE
jgi:predicted GIY-YIG superfamily endonuclease